MLFRSPTAELILISKNGEVKEDKREEFAEKKGIDLASMLKKTTDPSYEKSKESLLDKPLKDLTLRNLLEILQKL